MDYSIEKFKETLKNINFPKIKIPKIDLSSIKKKKPSRTFVVVIAVLLELVLLFVILWIFDDRTTFANDYTKKRSYGNLLKWGWIHKGVAITLILSAIALFFAILGEYVSYSEKDRPFYKLYKKKDEY